MSRQGRRDWRRGEIKEVKIGGDERKMKSERYSGEKRGVKDQRKIWEKSWTKEGDARDEGGKQEEERDAGNGGRWWMEEEECRRLGRDKSEGEKKIKIWVGKKEEMVEVWERRNRKREGKKNCNVQEQWAVSRKWCITIIFLL